MYMWTQNYIHSKAYKFLITACMGMTTVRRSRTFKAIQKKEGEAQMKEEQPKLGRGMRTKSLRKLD